MKDGLQKIQSELTRSNFFAQNGALLLLSVLATTTILAAALGLSAIFVREVRISKDIDNSILALLGAEGALEEGLYGFNKEGKTPGALSNSGTLNNGVSWQIQASSTKTEVIFDTLRKDLTEKVNLFNNDNPNQAAGVESISINWTVGSNLELAIREWNGTTLAAATTQTFPCGGTTPCGAVIVNSLSATKGYELTFKAVGANILDLNVKAWPLDNAAGTNVAIPVPITIEGTGNIGSARQALNALIPQPLPWAP